ncbi:MAG: hypothetical protein KAS53_11300 [Candidatus Cloacimonetes bacterium]|nr:hypothetical protein [Candidatus Cloacimonadota bacterium]
MTASGLTRWPGHLPRTWTIVLTLSQIPGLLIVGVIRPFAGASASTSHK